MKLKFRMSLILFVSSLVFTLLSCTSPQKIVPQEEVQQRQLAEVGFWELCNPQAKNVRFFRGPAQQLTCESLLGPSTQSFTNSVQNYLHLVSENEGIGAAVDASRQELVDDGGMASPVTISNRFQDVREDLLPLMKAGQAEAAAKVMEAYFIEKSNRLKDAFAKQDQNTKSSYDHVIIGGGVHGVLALAEILRVDPEARVLIVESTDTVAATFRQAADLFYINSSNRASGPGIQPLPSVPGRRGGNLNELPGLPVQVSELTARKYPTSGDLSRALIAGMYAALSTSNNVQLLLTTDAQRVTRTNSDGALELRFSFNRIPNSITASVVTPSVLIGSGIGEPSFPPSFRESLTRNPELVRPSDKPDNLPQVLTFEDAFRLLLTTEKPLRFFQDKKVNIIGTGDSANVLLEFLLGFGPEEAYGRSDAQDGRPREINWIGQSQQTCQDFLTTTRNRYSAVATGFRDNLKGVPSRARNISPDGATHRVELENGENVPADITIVATGFEGRLFTLFRELFQNVNSDRDLIEKQTRFLRALTSTSGGQQTNIARAFNPTPNTQVTIIGPAAGPLAAQAELVGVIQNFVSIFNNAPRSVAAARELAMRSRTARQRQNGANRAVGIAPQERVLESQTPPSTYAITNIQSSRGIGATTREFILSVMKEVLSNTKVRAPESSEFQIDIGWKNGQLIIQSQNNIDLEPIVKSLAQQRGLLGAFKNLLSNANGNRHLSFKTQLGVPGSRTTINVAQLQYQVRSSAVSRGASTTLVTVPASTVLLRGPRLLSNQAQTTTPPPPATNSVAPPANGSAQSREFLFSGDSVYVTNIGPAPIKTTVTEVEISPNGESEVLYTVLDVGREVKVARNRIIKIDQNKIMKAFGSTTAYFKTSQGPIELASVLALDGTNAIVNSRGIILKVDSSFLFSVFGEVNGIKYGDSVTFNSRAVTVLGFDLDKKRAVVQTENGIVEALVSELQMAPSSNNQNFETLNVGDSVFNFNPDGRTIERVTIERIETPPQGRAAPTLYTVRFESGRAAVNVRRNLTKINQSKIESNFILGVGYYKPATGVVSSEKVLALDGENAILELSTGRLLKVDSKKLYSTLGQINGFEIRNGEVTAGRVQGILVGIGLNQSSVAIQLSDGQLFEAPASELQRALDPNRARVDPYATGLTAFIIKDGVPVEYLIRRKNPINQRYLISSTDGLNTSFEVEKNELIPKSTTEAARFLGSGPFYYYGDPTINQLVSAPGPFDPVAANLPGYGEDIFIGRNRQTNGYSLLNFSKVYTPQKLSDDSPLFVGAKVGGEGIRGEILGFRKPSLVLIRIETKNGIASQGLTVLRSEFVRLVQNGN